MAVLAHLSAPPTPFVGRTRELDEVRGLLASGAWLLTLLGPPGVGKTRLALRVAELESGGGGGGTAARWPGGVWRCALAEARTVDDVCGAVAHALGAGELGTDPVAAVALRARELGAALVVLDNCEQVVGALAPALARWHAAAPEARWLATSRERLRLAGEQSYELEPLSLPGAGADARAAEAVQLFVQRASGSRAGYSPREAELEVVCDLVRRLDGLPLAIELAAARMRAYSAAAILERLSTRSDALGRGPRDAQAHQRTLRTAIEGSWELLDAPERRALAQCAVFRGGFALEAAEAVVDDAGAGALFDVVESLHDKSLLRALPAATSGGPARHGFYETIRAFALERLVASGELSAAAARHRRHYARWGRATADAARYDGDSDAAARLDAEFDNLVAAHDGALAAPPDDAAALEDALGLVVALARPMVARASLATYQKRLDATLARAEQSGRVEGALLASAYCERGVVHGLSGEVHRAVEAFDRAARHAGPHDFAGAVVRWQRAAWSSEVGRHAEARDGLAAARDTFVRLGRTTLAADATARLASLAVRGGDLAAAHEHCVRAVAMLRSEPRSTALGNVVGYLGTVEHLRGHLAEARAAYAEALPLLAAAGNRPMGAAYRGYTALLALEQDEPAQARSALDLALGDAAALGDRATAAWLTALDAALLARDDAPDAAEARFALAAGQLGEGASPWHDALAWLREVLALAHARHAERAGDRALAARLRSAAEQRLRERAATEQIEEALLARRLLAATLRRDTAGDGEPAQGAHPGPLVVHRAGDWFELPSGERVACRRKRVVRALLATLAAHRASAPGVPVELDALVAAAWPGERLARKTAQHRLHSAIYLLREIGLREYLFAAGDGFLLDPAAPFRLW